MRDTNNSCDGAHEVMLAAGRKPQAMSKEAKSQEEYEALQSFLRSISSTATLPPYVKGETYSSVRGVFNQCLITCAVLILAAGAGHPIGFSAVALPQLRTENSTMRIDDEMGSWIASIHSAATPLGSMVSGPVMEAIGRRRTLQASTLPLVLGWILIGTASHHALLLLGRIVCGFAVGILAAPSQVYLGEISEPRLRGLLIGTPFVAYSLGVLYVYTLGGAMSWRSVAHLSIVLPILAFAALCFSPESPTWLARRGRFHEAMAAMSRLRGDPDTAQRELHELISAREKEKARGEESIRFLATVLRPPVLKPLLLINAFNMLQILSGSYVVIFYAVDVVRDSGGSLTPHAQRELHELISAREKEKARGEESIRFLATVLRPPVLKPLLLINAFNMLQILSGSYVVIFYAVDVVRDSGGSLTPHMAANASACVRLGVTILACILLLKVTRRALVMVSGVGTAVCTFALAFLLSNGPGTGVTPPTLILGYVAFNTLGFFLLPGLMIGELLPTKVRGLCGGYIFCLFNAVLFGFTKLYPIMKNNIGMSGVFGLFGASATLATVVLFLLLPETKGKSLIQIEQYYQKPNILWVTRKRNADTQNV